MRSLDTDLASLQMEFAKALHKEFPATAEYSASGSSAIFHTAFRMYLVGRYADQSCDMFADAARWQAIRQLPWAGIADLWYHCHTESERDRGADMASDALEIARTIAVDFVAEKMGIL